MTEERRLKNLEVPQGPIDVVIDTDAFNEVDDQFAISYLLRQKDRLNTLALYAAPFFNANSTGPADGMEKSYLEIFKLLELLGEERPVFRGSTCYLPDEKTPVISDAAKDLAERVKAYSPEHPLYIVTIGAITNVASAYLLNPDLAENAVIVWLGGHAYHHHHTKEFNMMQDFAAARVLMRSGVPFVQLPCQGVVSAFTLSGSEMREFFLGTTPIAEYLVQAAIREAEKHHKGDPWTRVIWDVTAVAWLVNDGERFLRSRVVPVRLAGDDGQYGPEGDTPIRYVYNVNRDALMKDLVEKVTK